MKFSELNLHPAVAAALAKRGYESATPVQAAVLHPDAIERDLLVSSQTGSGKTIAFGAVLARSLLAPEATRTGPRTTPLALVIVPTRELAVQVRDELGWLLRDTKLRLASFTGGTPVSGDLRVLQKGLDIVIGTPGRLVDLLKRQRLELADVRAVVLDEADEMLDLGFREDLQTLLQAAPETRRTLLLSATLPSEIQALARRFQKDALRIDPRKDGDRAAPGAHDDITYVAHLIAGADRLAVVVNVLRASGDGRAIVFCTTREGVARLHAALLLRGFSATAISGERAQAERDRALEQLRKGDARVLVATNVAARGLHLPDVDLIVHADLPLNAESLTHRSGRTGRAGRKGTAVVIASMTERRKAERLMMSAHVPVVWTAPPSAESITAAARLRLGQELMQAATLGDANQEDPAADEMVKRLAETLPAHEIARRLLLREFARLPVGERVHHVAVPGPERRDRFAPARSGQDRDHDRDHDRGDGRRPGRGDFAREGVVFRVNIGAKDNADPRWLLPLICRRGGVISKDVGAIRVGPSETLFEISGDAARDFALSAAERDPRAPHVIFEPANAPPRPADNRDRDARERRPLVDARPASMGAPPAIIGRPGDAHSATKRSFQAPDRPPVPRATHGRPEGAAEPHPGGRPAQSKKGPAPPRVNKTEPAPSPPVARTPAAAKPPAVARAGITPAFISKQEGGSLPLAPPRTPPRSGGQSPPTIARSSEAAESARRGTILEGSRSETSVPQPASIFQTRTPEPDAPYSTRTSAGPSERVGRQKAHVPVIEVKRAPRVGPHGQRPKPERGGAPFSPGPEPERPRSDGTNPVKRSQRANDTRADGAVPSARPSQPATRVSPPGRPSYPARPPGGQARAPFWKDGARKRPGPPTRHPSGHAPTDKPARR